MDEITWVTVDHRVAHALVADKNGIVVEAAPAVQWAIGKPLRNVITFFRKRHAEITVRGKP